MTAFSKFMDGETLAERRARIRVERQAKEKSAKVDAKELDGGRCRWPHCPCKRIRQEIAPRPLEGAHIKAKGMGGNPDGSRNDARNIMSLCFSTHQGPRSLHSGHRRIEFLSEDGARGPCEFWMRDSIDSPWYLVASEVEPFIYDRD